VGARGLQRNWRLGVLNCAAWGHAAFRGVFDRVSESDILSGMAAWTRAWWVGVGCAVGGLISAGCRDAAKGRAAGDTTTAPVAVQVETVAWSREAHPVQVSGTLVRKEEASLGFTVGGIVGEVRVRAGDRVAAGQVLAVLRLEEVEGRLKQARANVERWRLDVERGRRLLADAVITREQLQHLEAALADGEGQLQAAEHVRRHAEVVAPGVGVVVDRMAEPGQVVSAGVPVIRFAGDSGGWMVRASLAESEVKVVRVGNPVSVRLAGEEKEALSGHVSAVAGGVDPLTRMVPVEMAVGAVPEWVRSGFTVTARIQPEPGEERAVVAASALVEGQGREAWVYGVREGRAGRVGVELEWFRGDRAWVRGALPREMLVVVQGAEFLSDGAPVRVAGTNLVVASVARPE
jgi:membrane fusion protein, multidrug efflux system